MDPSATVKPARLTRSLLARRRQGALATLMPESGDPYCSLVNVGSMPDGSPVRDKATLERIRSLAVPPAYKDVWICPHANGHIQATGRDDKGRKQYRYHPRWREVRDAAKFEHIMEFAAALPGIRARVDADMKKPGMPREKVLAAAEARPDPGRRPIPDG